MLELQKPEAIRKEGVSIHFAACASLHSCAPQKAQDCMLHIPGRLALTASDMLRKACASARQYLSRPAHPPAICSLR